MSDSQSSEQLQIKAEQKIEAKLRDLLERGKLITPFYDDDTLLDIYKDCYQTDSVFLNKLEIIAKNRIQAQNAEEAGWIKPKTHVKENNNRAQIGRKTQNRPKYNFLEDQALIERAKRFDPEREREKYERKQQQIRERRDNFNKNSRKNQYKEKQEPLQTTQQEKKIKYKMKEEDEAPKSQGPPPTNISTSNQPPKTTIKYQEKKQISNEKPAQQSPAQNGSAQQKKHEVPQEKAQVTYKAEPAPQNNISKTSEVVQKSEPVRLPAQQVKKPAKIQYRLKQEPNETKQLAAKPEVKAEAKVVARGSQKSIESPSKSQKTLDQKVKRQFQNSCKQNTFVLKFIPPSDRLQKVSYIREPNGTFRDVKVRQVLSKN